MRQLRFVSCNGERRAVEDDDEDEVFHSARVSLNVPDHQYHRPRRSFHRAVPLAASLASCVNHRHSFSYDRIQQTPVRFTVVKLDGSRFEIEVRKSGRVAELKQAVEKAFDHMPSNEPGKISWRHVWGHFCLCYDGQKLVKDESCIRDYGMKEGDELRFVHHVPATKRRMKKLAVKAEIQEAPVICDQLEAIQEEVEEAESDQWHAEDEVSTTTKGSMSTTSNLLKKFMLHPRPITSKLSTGFKGCLRSIFHLHSSNSKTICTPSITGIET